MAGFPGGRRPDGERLRLDLAYASSYHVAEDLAEVLRRQWSDNLGIELRVSKQDAAQYFSAILRGEYQAGYNNFVSIPDPTTYLLSFQLEEALGTFWRPPAFAALLEGALGTVDRTARLGKLTEGDRMIMEGMPLVPLIFEAADYLRKPYVRGLPMNVSSIYRFVLGLSNRWSFYPFEDFSPTGIVLALSVFTFILHGRISPRIEALAQPLAPLTLGVYLAHPIVVELLRYAYFLAVPILLRPPYYVPVTLLLTCAITFSLVALMQQVPGLRRIV